MYERLAAKSTDLKSLIPIVQQNNFILVRDILDGVAVIGKSGGFFEKCFFGEYELE